MTARILPIFLLFSTLTFAQNLPDAPKPKPPKPAQRMTFVSFKSHKKAVIVTGFAAAAATTAALILANQGSKHFKTECACSAQVPKR